MAGNANRVRNDTVSASFDLTAHSRSGQLCHFNPHSEPPTEMTSCPSDSCSHSQTADVVLLAPQLSMQIEPNQGHSIAELCKGTGSSMPRMGILCQVRKDGISQFSCDIMRNFARITWSSRLRSNVS